MSRSARRSAGKRAIHATAAASAPAAHILGERGWEGLTTNAVAAAAGVSIGSLYQYFPHKLALVETVRRRHFEQVLAVLHAAADENLPRTERIEALVDGMIGVHSRHPAAHRVLLEETPRGQDADAMHDRFTATLHRCYEAIVRANGRGERTAQPRIAAQVLAAAVAGVVHDAASRGTLRSVTLRHELLELVSSYL